MSQCSAARSDHRPSLRGPGRPEERLAYDHVHGRRDCVILIHGNSSCRQVFAAQYEALSATAHGVVALDLPGHGESEDAAEPMATYSFPGYAAAVGGLIDALGLEEVHLVGWSLGGHVALELAASDGRVKSVLVTGTPPIRPCAAALGDAFVATSAMALAGKERFEPAEADAYAAAMLGCDPARTPRALRDAALRTDGRARSAMMANGIAGVGTDQADFVAAAKIPIAIVQGRRDPFLRMDYLERLPAQSFWRGGVHWFDDLGHAPHFEAPARFNATLFAFLADIGARAEG